MLKEWAQIGGTKNIIAGIPGSDSGFVKLAGAASQGVYGAETQASGSQAPGWQQYTQYMTNYGGGTPTANSFAESGYVAGQTLIGTLKHISGTIDPATVESTLESGTEVSTLAGPVSFTANNHLGLTKLLITRVSNGQVTLTGTTENL
jgi:ABC-type branched-subunit amino acid transport system substrate-binding protein